MPNYTSRLGLQEPLTSDPTSALRLSITNNAQALDNTVLVTEGPLVDLPAATAVETGHRYYATDVGIELWNAGSVWIPTGPALPIGAMAHWSLGSDPVDPDGKTRWLVCDG